MPPKNGAIRGRQVRQKQPASARSRSETSRLVNPVLRLQQLDEMLERKTGGTARARSAPRSRAATEGAVRLQMPAAAPGGRVTGAELTNTPPRRWRVGGRDTAGTALCSTPRSQLLRDRFAKLSDRTFPAGKPATTLGELTADHLDYLRPRFFEGGRFSGAPGQPRLVPLRLGREAFAEAVQPVLHMQSFDSMLQLFSHMEVMSGGGGVTWNALLTFVRQSVEGAGLGLVEDGRAHCKYDDGQLGEQVLNARGTLGAPKVGEIRYLTLVGALGLAVADENTGSSDPTAIVFWNGVKIYQSSTKFATIKPVWRETVMLKLPVDTDQQSELCIELYDRDAATVCGDFLGRVLVQGRGLGGLSMSDKTLAFRLQPDPHKDDNSFVQGVMAIEVHDRDPATTYSVPDYVHLTEEIAAAHSVTRAATGVVESVTSVVGRAEQLRVAGHTWDRIVQILEHEHEGREKRGTASSDDQHLWWENDRQHRHEVMGVPKFVQPTSLKDENGHRTVGCSTPHMVDKIGVLDQYDSYFTACRGGIVHLWDNSSMEPANPPTVLPPAASTRPNLHGLNRDYFITAKLEALQVELSPLRVSELKKRAEAVGVEEKIIERRLDEARLDAMEQVRTI